MPEASPESRKRPIPNQHENKRKKGMIELLRSAIICRVHVGWGGQGYFKVMNPVIKD